MEQFKMFESFIKWTKKSENEVKKAIKEIDSLCLTDEPGNNSKEFDFGIRDFTFKVNVYIAVDGSKNFYYKMDYPNTNTMFAIQYEIRRYLKYKGWNEKK